MLDRDENGNGDATGCIEYTVGNWEGVAYKIPWSKKERCDNKNSTFGNRLKQSGLYCLLCKTNEGKTTVHIGKADSKEGVWHRVDRRHKDIKWTEAVVFVHHSSEKSFLDGAGLNYIEKKFYQLLKNEEKTGGYEVLENEEKTGGYEVLENEPSAGGDGTEESVLDNFAEKAKRLMTIILWYFKNFPYDKADEVLGRDDAEAQGQHEEEISPKNDSEDRLQLFLTYSPKGSQKKYRAEGMYIINEEFILKKGSEICPTETSKCPEPIRNMRKDHAGKIRNGVLTSDLKFGSPSGAAKFVCGASISGNTAWQDANKKTLGELLCEKED